MMITVDNVIRHELVGLRAEVAGSPCAGTVGASGVVVGETRSMLVLGGAGGGTRTRSFPKAPGEWVFEVPGGARVRVDGERITRRPAERLVSKA